MLNSNDAKSGAWVQVPIFAILLFEAAALIARSYVEVRMRDGGVEPVLAADLSYLVVPPMLVILMYPVLRQHGHLIIELYSRQTLTARAVVIGVSLGLTLRLAAWTRSIAIAALGQQPASDHLFSIGMYGVWSCPPAFNILFGLFISAVLIPIIEEAINRGFLMHYFLNRGRYVAILVSSVMFAILHDPQNILPAFIGGVYFAFAALNSGALWTGTIAHATYNFSTQVDGACVSLFWYSANGTSNVELDGAIAATVSLTSLALALLLTTPRVMRARFAPP